MDLTDIKEIYNLLDANRDVYHFYGIKDDKQIFSQYTKDINRSSLETAIKFIINKYTPIVSVSEAVKLSNNIKNTLHHTFLEKENVDVDYVEIDLLTISKDDYLKYFNLNE